MSLVETSSKRGWKEGNSQVTHHPHLSSRLYVRQSDSPQDRAVSRAHLGWRRPVNARERIVHKSGRWFFSRIHSRVLARGRHKGGSTLPASHYRAPGPYAASKNGLGNGDARLGPESFDEYRYRGWSSYLSNGMASGRSGLIDRGVLVDLANGFSGVSAMSDVALINTI